MALALCVGLLPVSALAADIEDWEDITLPQTSGEWTSKNNYDVSWYNTEDTSFTLSNAAELAGLAVIVKGLNGQDRDFFSGKTVTLATNGTFDLSGKTWTPITGFAGIFDGNNATISGMVIESASSSGLFSEIKSDATIKDLNIQGAYIVVKMEGYEEYPETSVGGLVGTNAGGTIQGCTFSGTIITNAYNIGGIAGRCTGTDSKVETCINNGTLESKRESTKTVYGVGGIVGLLHTGTVSNCTNNGTVTGYIGNPVGGVVGKMWDGTVSSCRNTAAVQGQEYSASGIGGIVGDISMSGSSKFVAITDCHNSGNVLLSAGKQRQIGGIVGQTSGASIEISQCSNTGKISSTQSGNSLKLGGLVGSTGDALTLTQSYNVGSVDIPSSTGYAGGLIGEATYPTSLQVENCYNVGAVTSGTAGGLIGRLSATDSSGRTVSISSSYNTGSVNNGTGNAMVGQTSTYVTLTVADNCTYLDTSGTGGLGRSQTANQMTDDTDWITNLDLNSSTWEKENNPTTVASDGNWMGNLPVLTANEQDPAPQIQRTQKQDQPGFAITDEPTPTDTIYIDSTGFRLGTTGGAEGLSVTWSSSDDKVATVDSNGKVTIKGVGEVTITAKKAGNDSYNEASDAYTFTVYGRPITEVTILNLAAPVQGESPRQNVRVPKGVPYEGLTSAGIGGLSTLQVTWREQGSDNVITTTFEQNKVYTVTMALKCDDYYSFDDSVTVYLSNMLESAYQKITAEKDTVNGHENHLIITVTFNPTSHVHNWATAWSSNATHHWHACTAKDCPLKDPQGMGDYAQHTDGGNGTCTVCGQIIGYLITFNPNGGVCEIQSTRTDVDGALPPLPPPTRSGYTFLGWYTEDGTQVGEDTVFTQDTT
ncbi:MAG: GLUG motif-containing protein, partial [Evtepia sp.]|nr:GLUG motif-containing protein [Evtepia sp.]